MGWFREWLHGDGDAASAPPPRSGAETATRGARAEPLAADLEDDYPGERFGLPETGPGSVATLPRRGAQFLLDAILAGLVTALFTYPELPRNWSLLGWAVLMVVPVAVIGMSPAMVPLGLRVLRLDRPDSAGIGLLWALVRTFSVFLVVPALIVDRDSRGLQDRVSRTVVVRTR